MLGRGKEAVYKVPMAEHEQPARIHTVQGKADCCSSAWSAIAVKPPRIHTIWAQSHEPGRGECPRSGLWQPGTSGLERIAAGVSRGGPRSVVAVWRTRPVEGPGFSPCARGTCVKMQACRYRREDTGCLQVALQGCLDCYTEPMA